MLSFPKSKNTTHPQIKCICKQGTYKNGISSVTLKYKNQYFTAQKIIKEGFFFFHIYRRRWKWGLPWERGREWNPSEVGCLARKSLESQMYTGHLISCIEETTAKQIGRAWERATEREREKRRWNTHLPCRTRMLLVKERDSGDWGLWWE